MAIGSPEIEWSGSTPRSPVFGDIYFSPQDGLAETEYVFLQGGGLPEAWSSSAPANFTLFEFGFGSALNFIATAALFLKTAPPGKKLHYISVEKFPFHSEELKRALLPFAEKGGLLFSEILEELCASYPARVPGFHRLVVGNGRVSLTLLFGEAGLMLDAAALSLQEGVDLWYLDGFDPAKNRQMWEESLYLKMAALSKTGAKVTTFTAAGFVRRGLEAAGFEVSKIPGFGKKREMITASFAGGAPPLKEGVLSLSEKEKAPWYEPPGPLDSGDPAFKGAASKGPGGKALQRCDVAVIGAGLAGCALAEALSRRRLSVSLIEKEGDIATAASGNPRGIFFPILHAKATPISRLSLAAFEYTLAHLKRLERSGHDVGFLQQGLLHLARDPQEWGHFQLAQNSVPPELACLVEPPEASRIAGVDLSHLEGARYYPRAGSLSPRDLCRANLALNEKENPVETIFHCRAKRLENTGEFWRIYDIKERLVKEASFVVLANSYSAVELQEGAWLPIGPFRGQLILLPEREPSSLQTNLNGESYLTPAFDLPGEKGAKRVHVAGATFDRLEPGFGPEAFEVNFAQSEALLQKTAKVVAAMGLQDAPKPLAARVSVRSAGVDHSPLIGPLPDFDTYLETFAGLAHGETAWLRKNGRALRPEVWHRGLYLLAGIGSRGIIYSLLGAEMIAAMICGEIPPVESSLARSFGPARFLYRKIKRGRM